MRETFVNYKRDSEIVSNELGREQVCRIYFFLGRFFISREKLKKDWRETTRGRQFSRNREPRNNYS